jgi:4-amino-4-deoxy-L-arabinose transferase-like glycosyltransferase
VTRRAALVLFGGALALRVAYLASIHGAIFFDHLQTEPAHYDAWARAIVAGEAPIALPFDEAPGYPYFVALIYAIVGPSPLAAAIVQALLGAAACVAIAIVAGRLAGARAAWIAGAIAACYGPLLYFTGQLEPAALATAAVAGALVATPFEDAPPRRWLYAGAVWAAAIVVRSELVLAIPALAVHAWWCGGRRSSLRAAAPAAGLVALSLAANAIASGHAVVLTTGSGVNLWLGNNPDADGVNPFVHGRLEAVARAVEAAGGGDAVAIDRGFRARAWRFVGDDPGAAAALVVKKLAWTWTHRELPNAADIQWQTSKSWVFVPPWFPIGFGLVAPLAFAGAVLAGRAAWRRGFVIVAPIAVVVIACAVFFTNARFRLVMAPSLVVLAAIAIERVAGGAWRDRKRIAIAGAVATIAACLAWLDLYGVARYRIPQIDANTGALEHAAGRLDAAERYLRSAVRGDPRDGGAWIELALVLEQAGRDDDARAVLRDAVASAPDDPRVRALAARVFR